MKVLLGLCLFGVAFSKSPDCCAPEQWEGTVELTQGSANPGYPALVQTGTIETHFDYTNQQEARFSQIQSGPILTQMKVFRDYISKSQFTLHLNSGKCDKQPLLYAMQKTCTPTDAVSLPPSRYGEGSEKTLVDNYRLITLTPPLTQMISFTRQGCLPFENTMWGNLSGVPILQIYRYTNLTEGIQDKSVFNIPAQCHQ